MSNSFDLCVNCGHRKDVHHSGVCNGDLSCLCSDFIEPLFDMFKQKVEAFKIKFKNIKKRCEFILTEIPQTRNAGEKTFYKIYIEIYHGFKIRKGTPQVLDTETWKRLPNQDTVNRAKRSVKQFNEELKTYSPKTIIEQNVIFEAMLEMIKE